MNVTLSDRLQQDVTILLDKETTKHHVPWSLELGVRLDGFLEAIEFLSAIQANKGHSDGDGSFCLADAAYALNNAGAVWGREVDDTARCAQQTIEILKDFESRKIKAKINAPDAEQKADRVPQRHTNPLQIPTDEGKKSVTFLSVMDNRKIPLHQFISEELPHLSAEAYLSPYEPSTLPLMDCERIFTYLDDRGNKGHDWAEFRINTLKLNNDGYYPLEFPRHGPKNNAAMYKRRYTFSVMPVWNDNAGEKGFEDFAQNNPVEEVDGFVAIPEEDGDGMVGNLRTASGMNVENHTAEISFANLQRIITIRSIKKRKNLHITALLPQSTCDSKPFKRRNKRKAIPKKMETGGVELNFFQHFWNIHEPNMDFDFVLRRYGQRLKEVEVVVEKGRGRKKPVKKVQFVSMTPLEAEEPDENTRTLAAQENRHVSEATKLENGAPTAAMPSENLDFVTDEAADYEELDIPCGDDNAIQLDANENAFENMARRGAFYKLNNTEFHPDNHTTQYFENLENADETIIPFDMEIDIRDWEARLVEFLQEHEAVTANFNLENFGERLMQNHKKKSKRESFVLSDVIGIKKTSGEVGRAFLSILDMLNKNVVSLDPKKNRIENASCISGDAQIFALRIPSKTVL